ncbi:hypothetical protein [Lysobacter brunescens]|uniref:Lipoprotein n=1 Tax=Lysobacter brunescens TaxID=262323 RepID=A0ABW2YDW3_9GAMM
MRHAVAIARVIAGALMLAACAHGAWHEAGIALPRAPAGGRVQVLLEVELGAIGSGQEVVLRTQDGQLIGTASPHGIRSGRAAGTYLIPVPARVLASLQGGRRLHLRAWIERAGAEPREADEDEVLDIRLAPRAE